MSKCQITPLHTPFFRPHVQIFQNDGLPDELKRPFFEIIFFASFIYTPPSHSEKSSFQKNSSRYEREIKDILPEISLFFGKIQDISPKRCLPFPELSGNFRGKDSMLRSKRQAQIRAQIGTKPQKHPFLCSILKDLPQTRVSRKQKIEA